MRITSRDEYALTRAQAYNGCAGGAEENRTESRPEESRRKELAETDGSRTRQQMLQHFDIAHFSTAKRLVRAWCGSCVTTHRRHLT